MSRLFFYAVLSMSVAFAFYLLHKSIDFSDKENFIPTDLRLMLLGDKTPIKFSDKERDKFIIGTSHVEQGFDKCNEIWTTLYLSGMSGARSIRAANNVIFRSLLVDLDGVDVVLEVTLIEEIIAAQKKNSMVYQYIYDAVPVISDLVGRHVDESSDNCGKREFNTAHRAELNFSRALSEQLNDASIRYLFSQYKYHLDKLVSVCSSVQNSRITLVSFPVRSDLYAFPKVKNTFDILSSEMAAYLEGIQGKNSCDISYINLAELGAEFPEHKFWVDPGHFRPEVGKRILREIELFHANKKLH